MLPDYHRARRRTTENGTCPSASRMLKVKFSYFPTDNKLIKRTFSQTTTYVMFNNTNESGNCHPWGHMSDGILPLCTYTGQKLTQRKYNFSVKILKFYAKVKEPLSTEFKLTFKHSNVTDHVRRN